MNDQFETYTQSNDVTFHFSNLKMVLIALPCAAYAAIFTLLAKSVANAEFDLSLPYLCWSTPLFSTAWPWSA